MLNWIEEEKRRKYHEISNLFPLLTGEEFDALVADIATNGLLEPIWLHPDGSILDGRNRHRACIETETPPRFRTWDGTGSLVTFVVSMNLHRRHLTSSQQAACSVEAKEMIAVEIKQEEAKRKRHQYDRTSEKFPKSSPRDAAKEAAQLFHTNPHYVQDATRLKREAPELFERVRAGKVTIPQAKRELTKRKRVESPPPLPTNKYRVIYADPPWKYSNAGIIGDTDNYGHVERHYPTMSIAELCAMGTQIQEMTEDNAVLFLWVTSPLLAECFPVIKAWGFKYKTSFVWDKVKHNFGHYNSVRHELLLVCTRGSCTPDARKLFDSVQVIERTDRHSEKPEQFREIIDTLYTHGRRIELFARTSTIEGWEAWGNEPN